MDGDQTAGPAAALTAAAPVPTAGNIQLAPPGNFDFGNASRWPK